MINETNGKNLLSDTIAVLDIVGVPCFITDGTLLGFYREGKFIDHDLDIDLGTFADFWDSETVDSVIQLCADKGIDLKRKYGILDRYFEMTFTRDNINIDIFFYRKCGENYEFHAFKNGGANLPDDLITYFYPCELLDDRVNAEFLGIDVMIPARTEEFVAAKYGKNWRVPVKKWDWQFGPHNVKKV